MPFIEECGGNAKQLISDPDVLVSISANPLLEMNPKVDPIQLEVSENNTDPWCSTPPTARAAFNPYLIFEFSSTYLIEVITISGRSASNRFVEALTIKNDTGQGFAFINNNGIPKVSQLLYNIIGAQHKTIKHTGRYFIHV